MTNIIINDKNRSIEISKKFADEARKFGSPEYNDLQEARQAYPKYKVVVRKVKKARDSFKGLTYAYMEKYIKTKEDARKKEIQKQKEENPDIKEEPKNEYTEILIEFYTICGKDENGDDYEISPTAAYGEVKRWFRRMFPEIDNRRDTINEILGKTKKVA